MKPALIVVIVVLVLAYLTLPWGFQLNLIWVQ